MHLFLLRYRNNIDVVCVYAALRSVRYAFSSMRCIRKTGPMPENMHIERLISGGYFCDGIRLIKRNGNGMDAWERAFHDY